MHRILQINKFFGKRLRVKEMKKKLIVHVGFHKTGSSALQAFLSKNAEILSSEGIGYPYPDPKHIVESGSCSGNAMHILQKNGFIKPGETNKPPNKYFSIEYYESLIDIIKSDKHNTIVISSEVLSENPGSYFSEFISKSSSMWDVEIICFVRDPFDFVFSAWRQQVKEAANVPNFFDYVINLTNKKNFTLSMLNFFEFFCSLGIPIRVINYDYAKEDVAGAFFSAAGFPSIMKNSIFSPPTTKNESLTPSEAFLVQKINDKIGNIDFTKTLARKFILRNKRRHSSYYKDDIHKIIIDGFYDSILLINSHLSELTKLSIDVRNEKNSDFSIETEDFSFFLDLLSQFISTRKDSASPNEAPLQISSELPDDFDPEAYLLHNPDVAAAGVDPAAHYLRHGREENRRYRLF